MGDTPVKVSVVGPSKSGIWRRERIRMTDQEMDDVAFLTGSAADKFPRFYFKTIGKKQPPLVKFYILCENCENCGIQGLRINVLIIVAFSHEIKKKIKMGFVRGLRNYLVKKLKLIHKMKKKPLQKILNFL